MRRRYATCRNRNSWPSAQRSTGESEILSPRNIARTTAFTGCARRCSPAKSKAEAVPAFARRIPNTPRRRLPPCQGRRVHALVEKPLASSLADCDAMLAAARAHTRPFSAPFASGDFTRRVQRIRRAIDDGKIGKPVLGTATMFGWRDEAYYQSDPWRGSWQHARKGRRRARQPIAPSTRHVALVYRARSRRSSAIGRT